MYRLVAVHTHGNLIVLPHWDNRPPAPWAFIPLSWHWANQSLPYPNNAECQARKWQVSILKSLVWLHQGSTQQGPDSNPRGSDSPIFQYGSRTLYSFGHPVWCGEEGGAKQGVIIYLWLAPNVIGVVGVRLYIDMDCMPRWCHLTGNTNTSTCIAFQHSVIVVYSNERITFSKPNHSNHRHALS